jgi:putative transposase
MKLIDEQYTATPFYGSRRMMIWLGQQGRIVNRKRVIRLMQKLGLQAIYPKPNLSRSNKEHEVYPYLLRDVPIERVGQVWSSDITYIRMRLGFVYLTAVLDWFSRYVLSWRLSISLEGSFCKDSLNQALQFGRPEIFNTDQGAQYTSSGFTEILKEHGIQISMDGRGRALDNVFVERLWRSVKWEEVYLRDYGSVAEARSGLRSYFRFYNYDRPHQSLGYRTPAEVFGVCR